MLAASTPATAATPATPAVSAVTERSTARGVTRPIAIAPTVPAAASCGATALNSRMSKASAAAFQETTPSSVLSPVSHKLTASGPSAPDTMDVAGQPSSATAATVIPARRVPARICGSSRRSTSAPTAACARKNPGSHSAGQADSSTTSMLARPPMIAPTAQPCISSDRRIRGVLMLRQGHSGEHSGR